MSSFLDGDELADLRGDIAATFDGSCTLLRKTAQPNGRGQQTEAWVPTGDPIPCTAWNGNRESDLAEALVAGRVTSAIVWHVLMPWDGPATAQDRLRMSDGRTLEINGLNRGRTDALAMLAICREVGTP